MVAAMRYRKLTINSIDEGCAQLRLSVNPYLKGQSLGDSGISRGWPFFIGRYRTMLKKTEFEWQMRERTRLLDGEHQQIPIEWLDIIGRADMDTRLKVHLNYYPHVSKKDPSKLAYTESPEKGEKDIQSIIKPGKFLKKVIPDLTDVQVQELVQAFNGVSVTGELKLATTEQDIIDVYRNGPNSCMAHPATSYGSSPIHPVSVYASGDIGIAYLKKEGAERISCRTVVRLKTKKYVRIYGEPSLLKPLLEQAGYEQDSYALDGARLLKKENQHGETIAPYLDGSATDISINCEYLHIQQYDGDYTADNTNGLLSCGDVCYNCACSVYSDECSTYNGDYYCDACFEQSYFYCFACGESTNRDEACSVPNNETVCQHCFDLNYFRCGDCDKNHHDSDNSPNHDETCTDCGKERDAEEDERERDAEEQEKEVTTNA